LAQPSHYDRKSNDPKHFKYEMLNLVNTSIIVENRNGYYSFYGKIMPKRDYFLSERDKVYPTEKDNLFTSENPFYTLFSFYQLS
jgi:hypothetical protein